MVDLLVAGRHQLRAQIDRGPDVLKLEVVVEPIPIEVDGLKLFVASG